MTGKIEELGQLIEEFIKAYGWDAMEQYFVDRLGFSLTEKTTLDDGAIQSIYTHPDGAIVKFTCGQQPQE